MSKSFVITEEKWRALESHGRHISGEELLTRLSASMTEVEIPDDWKQKDEFGEQWLVISVNKLGHLAAVWHGNNLFNDNKRHDGLQAFKTIRMAMTKVDIDELFKDYVKKTFFDLVQTADAYRCGLWQGKFSDILLDRIKGEE